jgi:hypothetical protein
MASKMSASQPIVQTSSIALFRNTTVLSVPSDNSGHGSIATRKPSLQVLRKGDKHSKYNDLAAYVDNLYA